MSIPKVTEFSAAISPQEPPSSGEPPNTTVDQSLASGNTLTTQAYYASKKLSCIEKKGPPEDYHRFRTKESKRAMEQLDRGNTNSKEIGEFHPGDNTQFLDLLHEAAVNQISVDLFQDPRGAVIVHDYNDSPLLAPFTGVGILEMPWHGTRYRGHNNSRTPSVITNNARLAERMFERYSREDTGSIKIYPIQTFIEGDAKKVRVTTVNYGVDGPPKILFQRIYESSFNPDEVEAEIATAYSLQDELAQVSNQLKITEQDKQRWLNRWAFDRLEPGKEGVATTEDIQREWAQGNLPKSISVKAYPSSYEADTDHGQVSLWINSALMKRSKYAPIGIRGDRIEISVLKTPEEKVLYDHGVTFNGVYDAGGVWILQISSPVFAENSDTPRWKPIDLDLRSVRRGELKHTFYQEVKKPVNEDGPYQIYVDHGPDYYDKYRERIDSFALGIGEAEYLFGEKQGSTVKKIYVPNTISRNATVDFSHPDRVNVYDEEIQSGDIGELKVFGRHEAFHSFDEKYKFFTHPDFNKFFIDNGEKKDFFNFINESFMFELPFGGHAQENIREFVATLSNSVESLKLQEKLLGTTSSNRVLYRDGLLRLRESIIAKVPNGASLPIIAKIDGAIELTKAIIDECG